MVTVNRYSIYCQTDAKWEYIWAETQPTTCPINAAHTITPALTTLIDTVSSTADSKFTSTSFDAFGRLRVSDPYTILDLKHLVGIDTLQQETYTVTGSGTYTPSATLSMVDIQVTSSVGTVKVQTRKRGIYQPGKSLLVLITGILNSGTNAVGCVSRMGYYDDNNGYFFEYSNPTLYLVERSAGVDTKIAQSNWNISTYGAIDITKTLIFGFDLEWLGVGSVRAFVVIDGMFILLHHFKHSNLLTKPYMNTASQPIRYEIFNTTTSQAGKLTHICATVISEGGFNPTGREFTISNGITAKSMTNTVMRPMIAIRLKSTNLSVNVLITRMKAMSFTSARLWVGLYLFRDLATSSFLTGASWVSTDVSSAVEYDVSSTAINMTSAFPIVFDYMGSDNSTIEIDADKSTNISLTANILGYTDYIVLCIQTVSNAEDVVSALGWKEIL